MIAERAAKTSVCPVVSGRRNQRLNAAWEKIVPKRRKITNPSKTSVARLGRARSLRVGDPEGKRCTTSVDASGLEGDAQIIKATAQQQREKRQTQSRYTGQGTRRKELAFDLCTL